MLYIALQMHCNAHFNSSNCFQKNKTQKKIALLRKSVTKLTNAHNKIQRQKKKPTKTKQNEPKK